MSENISLDRYDDFIERNGNCNGNGNGNNDINFIERKNKHNDLNLFHTEGCLEVGVDEVGRGALIGRVYAAAVIWPNDSEYIEELEKNMRIRDSKKLSKKKREMLYENYQP